jgi:hypothetical protein
MVLPWRGHRVTTALESSPLNDKMICYIQILHFRATISSLLPILPFLSQANMVLLTPKQLQTTVSAIAEVLDSLKVQYALMGGAAVCLMIGDSVRRTEDVDLVIQVDERSITADKLTHHLLASYPDHFGPINQFGHIIPGYKLILPGGTVHLVELEVFDQQSWPQRPQYDLRTTTAMTLPVNERHVKIFNSAWMLREKILSQYGRQGTSKEQTDIKDVRAMAPFVSWGEPELDFDNGPSKDDLKNALINLLQKRPEWRQLLKQKIKCTAVFGNW